MLLLFADAGPAAAEGLCSADDPNTTVINLGTEGGYILQFTLHLEGDKITGKLFANPAHPGEIAVHGSVNGQFYPGKGMYLEVYLYPPAKPGSQFLISGTFTEGSGRGDLKDTAGSAERHTWIARTAPGCPKWPEDVFRHDLAKAAEAHADSAASALAAANPLYACDMSSWSSTSPGSLGHEFVSDCASKIAGTLPWGNNPQPGRPVSAGPGPGSMPWQACEASLKKRVDAIIESMRPTCEKAQRLQEAKNRCIPTHTTSDGKIYQNVPSPFTSEGKDVQLCMNQVQGCFDRNAGKEAQDSCASHVAGCFDFGNDARGNAAVKLFGAGAVNSALGINARASKANLFCLSMGHSSDAITAFVPTDWSVFVGGAANGPAVRNTYADVASLVGRCTPKIAALSALLARRASVSLAFADLPVIGTALGTTMGTTRLVSLNPDDGCLAKTPPAATIPPVRLPPDGRVPPKVTNRGKPSQGSSGASLAAPGRGTAVRSEPSIGTNKVRGGCNSAMDRLSGDCIGGGASPGSRLPDSSRGPIRQGGTASSGSSGASTARSSTPQGSSGASMPAGGPGVSGTFGPASGSGSGAIRMNRPSNIDMFRQPSSPPPSDAYRSRVN